MLNRLLKLKRKFDINKALDVSIFLLFIFCIYVIINFIAKTQGLEFWFNSDSLVSSFIFKDVFSENMNISGWRISFDTWIFPDMLIQFFLLAIFQNVVSSTMIIVFFQLICFYFLTTYVLKLILPTLTKGQIQIFNLSKISFLLLLMHLNHLILPIFSYFLLTNNYFSIFLLCLLNFVLLSKYLQSSKSVYIISYLILSILSSFSSPVFIFIFSIPIIFVLPFLKSSIFVIDKKNKTTIGDTTILSIVISSFITQILIQKKIITSLFELDRILKPLILFGSAHKSLIKYLDLLSSNKPFLIANIVLGLAFIINSKALKSNSSKVSKFFLIFSNFFICSSIFSVIFLNLVFDQETLRYLFPALVFSLLSLCCCGYDYLNQINIKLDIAITTKIFIVCALVAFESIVMTFPFHNQEEVFANYYPDISYCLDQKAKSHHIAYGLSEYWSAKQITQFSRSGIKINQIYPEGSPNIWQNNINWYKIDPKTKKEPIYNFVIMKDLEPFLIKTRFGDPDEIWYCEDQQIYFYQSGLTLEFTHNS